MKGEDAAQELEFHDGAEDPSYILALAGNWNRRIESDFSAYMEQLLTHAKKDEDGKALWLTGRPTDIYSLKKAAFALDGEVHDFGDYALLINERRYLTALIQPEEMAEIEAAPGNYVSFTVCPK